MQRVVKEGQQRAVKEVNVVKEVKDATEARAVIEAKGFKRGRL